MTGEHPIVIFDGECGFCDRMVDFILERDPEAIFRFASRQSPEGRRLLLEHGLPEEGARSVVLLEGRRAYLRSTAGLRIARRLRGGWSAFYAFVVVPEPLRDTVYDVVSRNRLRLSRGRRVCSVPTPERQARFLSEPRTRPA